MPTMIYVGVTVVGLLVLLKFLVRKIGCNCHHCGGRMHFLDELAAQDRQDIMAYFQKYERRTPDTSSIFVCPRCKYVYDDFSGEKISMDGDNASFCKICNAPHVNYLGQFARAIELDDFRLKNSHLLDKTECLRCQRNPTGTADCILCDTKFKVMGCRRCKTLYAWVALLEKKFLYMVPLTEDNIIPKGPTRIPL